MVGGLGQTAGQAGKELSGLDEQMEKNAASSKTLSSAIEELPKMMQSGTPAIVEMTDALKEHRPAIEETGAAYESFSENVQKASKTLRDGLESANLQNANLNTVAEMWNDPAPFEMLQQHLQTTGQTWSDFSTSVGDDNVALIEAMKRSTEGSFPLLDTMSSKVEATSATFTSSANDVQVFGEAVGNSSKNLGEMTSKTYDVDQAVSDFLGPRKGFSAFATSAQDADQAVSEFLGKTKQGINELGGVGKALYGPELPEGGLGKVAGIGDIFGGASEGMLGMLNDIAMPLMAIQMVGMAVQYVGQSIYDSAAIAEGAGAHSFGSFTGTVDALGQSVQKVSGQFSESFGRQIMPTLNALNMQASGSGDGGGYWGGILGGILATATNLWQIGSGTNIIGGTEGLINQGAAALGLPQPFQGPGPEQQAQIKYQQQMAQLPQTVYANAQQLQYQGSLTLAQATDPNWLAANNQALASQQAAQYLVQSYNTSHPIPQSQLIAQAQYNTYAAEQTQAYQRAMATGNYQTYGQAVGGDINAGDWGKAGSDLMGGIGNYLSEGWAKNAHAFNSVGDFFGSWWDNFWGINNADGSQRAPTTSMGGCFIAGTPVLLADGSEKAIELLRVDEQVLAYDGKQQVPATIIGCISFPAKQTYALTFDDGNTLITTDSHPLAGENGWKSISPGSTAQENPDLPVTALQVGDTIYTAGGTLCRLVSIQKRNIEQVYNITVDGSHTYYASGVLVHNAKQSSLANDGTGSQQVQVSHTFVANVQWEANNLTKQFTGAASWVGQNLANTFQGAASWVAQGLSNTFQGATTWVAQGLSNIFQGVTSWVAQGLSNTFNGVASWVGQGLSNTFNGVASWAAEGLSNTFKGIASWVGSGLEHTFNAVANWTAQNLSPNFTVNPSFTMLAEGTSDWPGGPAIVGEAGPEVVEHNGQYSMFDAGASLVNLPPGANVYPMKNLQGSSVAQFANGTGENVIPLNIGLKNQGGNMPESINVYLNIDGQTFWSATGMSLAQSVYAGSGNRSY
jgi:hypothetical protein